MRPATPWAASPVLTGLEHQTDARLTDPVPMKRQGRRRGQSNFALPCAADYVKRQQFRTAFRTWKGGRVV